MKQQRLIQLFYTCSLLLLVSSMQAQWRKTGGPTGAAVWCFTNMGSTVFAGLDGGGIYRRSVHDTSWVKSDSGLTNDRLMVLFADSSRLYAGTNGDGVFQSLDSGKSWSRCFASLNVLRISDLKRHRGILYASVLNKGIYRSSDEGTTWDICNAGLTDKLVQCLYSNGSTLLAGIARVFSDIHASLYYSVNNGNTWSPVVGDLPSQASVGCLAGDSRVVYLGTWGDGLFKSTDGGMSWRRCGNDLDAVRINNIFVHNGEVYIATNDLGFFKSSDEGASWVSINEGLCTSSGQAITKIGNTLYGSSFGKGNYCLVEGASSWVRCSDGLLNEFISAMCSSANNLVAATESGMMVSTNDGESWIAADPEIGCDIVTAFLKRGSRLYAGSENYGVRVSTDNGLSWKTASEEISGMSIQCMGQSDRSIFVVANKTSLLRSSDNGATWVDVSDGLYNSEIRGITQIHSVLLVSTSGYGVFRSTNDGDSWTRSSDGLGTMYTQRLVVQGSDVYVSAFATLYYRSTDDGETWFEVFKDLSNIVTGSLFSNGSQLFLWTSPRGVITSSDRGASWVAVESDHNLKAMSVSNLCVHHAHLFAGVNRQSVWSTNTTITSAVEETPHPELSAGAWQVYPNPAQSLLHFRRSDHLAQDGTLSIRIRSSIGRILYQESFNGQSNPDIDISSLSPGLCFVEIHCGDASTRMPLSIIR